MTEKELNRLRDLYPERKVLRQEAEKAQAAVDRLKAEVAVQGSRSEEPYNLHAVSVVGLPDTAQARQAGARLQRVKAELAAVEMEILRLERFIREVRDPIVQKIMVRHYVEGKSWVRISLDYGKESSWARKKVQRFF